MYGVSLFLVMTSLFISPPAFANHDDYECMSHDYCDYDEDEDNGETYCFFGCDNIIIIPGLPGMGGKNAVP